MSDSQHPEIELFREPTDDDEGRAGPRIFVVGGAKGGVGKTLLAANVGVYIATLGRRAVVADADAGGANLHSFLGVPHPNGLAPYEPPLPVFRGVEDDAEGAEVIPLRPSAEEENGAEEPTQILASPRSDTVDVSVPGLRLLHCGIDEPARGERRRARRGKLMNRLRALGADFVVLDLGAGTHRSILDLWLDGDVGVFVTLPEPTAIEGTYRFVRSAFARQLLRAAADPDERRQLVVELRRDGNNPPPLDLLRRLESERSPLVSRVAECMATFRFPFVVNQTRLRADLELGEQMESAARRRLGLSLDYMGHADTDDTVWHALRVGRPLLVESPGTKASRNIEKIARRLLALDAGKHRRRSPPDVPAHTHHDLLEVDRGATDEEIRRAYKRARDLYGDASLACYGLFDPRGRTRLRARLEEAHDVLLDGARRRPYELSVFPPVATVDVESEEEGRISMPSAPPPTITPETDFTGALLRAVRESRGVRLKDIAATTKIGTGFLRAIEEDDFASLPATVYVRGFLIEVAKCLRLDPQHVSRTYVRRLQRWADERERLA
ncbi:MAG: helix-turn-helix domain-containing protein [Myxococcales bacterium]|nr:helix-turn-helix domain-containing protein [Myxococcales bacterium]